MLALVGGAGRLPSVLMQALDGAGRPFRLCELEGFEVAGRGDRPVMRFRLETLGSFIAKLVEFGVTEVCFAGRVDRPDVDLSKVDAATEPLLPMIASALRSGDDAALRIVLKFFEQAGIAIVSATDIDPTLLPEAGILTRAQPDDTDRADADRGVEIIAAMAQADVGQACVVANGQALALEALPGTDWMLHTLAPPAALDPSDDAFDWIAKRMDAARTRRDGGKRPDELPGGGVMVKAAKPGQDRRVDLPTIGIETIRAAHDARLNGIVIEAGSVIVLDIERVVELAKSLGVFLWVRP